MIATFPPLVALNMTQFMILFWYAVFLLENNVIF